jgi:hypothetical protein
MALGRLASLTLVTGCLLLATPVTVHTQPQTKSTQKIPDPLLDEYAKGIAENWVWFGGGFKQDYWFCPNTIRRTAQNTFTVWSVSIQSFDSTGDWTSARRAIITQRKRARVATLGYESYLLTKVQWEMDCSHHMTRVLQIVDYDKEGAVLHSWKLTGEMEEPVPDSNGDGLLRIYCNPSQWKTFGELIGPPPRK